MLMIFMTAYIILMGEGKENPILFEIKAASEFMVWL